jgi:hypothetical protein
MVMRIEEIKNYHSKFKPKVFVDLKSFKTMNISKRTGQTWRDDGISRF